MQQTWMGMLKHDPIGAVIAAARDFGVRAETAWRVALVRS